jgi:deazaflavin-dependent oxidoreductase (nitroreductase family)
MPLPRSLARFNKRATNHVSRLVAGRLPGFAIVEHQGRRSGRNYRTPVNAFRRAGGFELALTYGEDADWIANVEAAHGARLEYRGKTYAVDSPRIVNLEQAEAIPRFVHAILDRLDVDSVLLLDQVATPPR